MEEKLRASLFDFDDTLMATRERRLTLLATALHDFGHDVSAEGVLKHWGKPFNKLIASIAPGIDYDQFQRHYAESMRGYPPRCLPGARRLLRQLYVRGIPVVVVSNGSGSLVRQDLEAGVLWRYVSQLWAYEDTAYHKPDPRALRPILRSLEQRHVHAEQTAYVGDSVSDFQVASRNGLDFWAVLTGTDTREDFLAVGATDDHVVRSLSELSRRLRIVEPAG